MLTHSGSRTVALAVSVILAATASFVCAADGAVRPLLVSTGTGGAPKISGSSEQISVKPIDGSTTGGVSVTIQPGKDGYPGVSITPVGGPFDLGNFGRIEAKLTNSSTAPLALNLRVDNAADFKLNPWNSENITIAPGATETLVVHFGYSYGGQPGYKLKPEAVSNLVVFSSKTDTVRSFRIESLQAAGSTGEKPSDDPRVQAHKPKDGLLLGPGLAQPESVASLDRKDLPVSSTPAGSELAIAIPAGTAESSLVYKLAAGRWDLRDALEVRVKLHNSGDAPLKLKARVSSTSGPTDWSALAELAPNADAELVIPFFSASIWNGEKGTGTQFVNDKATEVDFAIDAAAAARKLSVTSIKAGVPVFEAPEWLGKRPPVPGDWKVTLDENFESGKLDDKIWSITGENYWDKSSHFSKDNVILGGGVVKIRFEKKHGHHNDDPKRQETDYAVGFLTSFGKFTQRYGYFEARMKLPTAPGLWPAFWMMPDRGPEAGEDWKRSDTGHGGMEFDIMEYLTRWGPHRYNIAMHWDGYGKDHKATGTDKIYAQPDKDGYIVSGLLWQKGLLVYYCNGHEVLRYENPRVGDVPEHLMFTLPCGGWDNSPLDDAKLPDDFVIDYVRAWQLPEPKSDGK